MTYLQPWYNNAFYFFFTKYSRPRNLYYMESADGGVRWTTVDGTRVWRLPYTMTEDWEPLEDYVYMNLFTQTTTRNQMNKSILLIVLSCLLVSCLTPAEEHFISKSMDVANLMIDHPNMPEDMIPYWDYLSSDIPDTYRDASAAAIMASALVELSGFADPPLRSKYHSVAEIQLRTLSSPEYLAEPGTNGFFILKRSVGHLLANSEVDECMNAQDDFY